jgi:alpha-1,6-mannosyltransferase
MALISCVGHKEWRFVVYVVPVVNVAAARGARWMYVAFPSLLLLLGAFGTVFIFLNGRVSRPKGTLIGRVLFLSLIALVVANGFATYLLTSASMANYPGGEALARFNARYVEQEYGRSL